MELHLSPELQNKVNRVAAENRSDPDGYVQQLVASYLDHDIWFRGRVARSLQSLDRGEGLSHEEVGERIERMFAS